MASEEDKVLAFCMQFNKLLGITVAELYRLLKGEVPEEVRRDIHRYLPAVYETAMDLRKDHIALAGLDLFLAMFPPPEPEQDSPPPSP